MPSKFHNVKKIILVVALAVIPFSAQAKKTEVSSLTAQSNVWQGTPRVFIERFANAPGLKWANVKNEAATQQLKANNLTFWGNPISSVKISEGNGLLNRISFEIIDKKKMQSTNVTDFKKQAAAWKKRLDKKFGVKGKHMASVQYGEVRHNRTGWSFDDCIVILSAVEGKKPNLLEFSCYARTRGLAESKLKGQQLKGYVDNTPKRTVPTPRTPTRPRDHRDDHSDASEGREEQEIRSTIREILARRAPRGIEKGVQDAVNLLNVYRYLSSVPYNVQASKEYVAASIDAAQICAKKGQLSHGFGHSTDKCNLAMNTGRLTMKSSVMQYVEDSGANNREKRGHRRWCLNHRMGKTGFGIQGAYSAMYSIDGSGKAINKNYSYPGHGYYPISYLHGNGWSYHMVKGKAPKDAKVEVWRLRSKDRKPPNWSDRPDGTKLTGTFVYTYSDTIVFEPQNAPVTKKGHYLVRIKGRGFKEQYLVKLF